MKTPVEIIVSVLNNRAEERNVQRLLNPNLITDSQDRQIRRLSRQIGKKENQADLCSDQESVYL